MLNTSLQGDEEGGDIIFSVLSKRERKLKGNHRVDVKKTEQQKENIITAENDEKKVNFVQRNE